MEYSCCIHSNILKKWDIQYSTLHTKYSFSNQLNLQYVTVKKRRHYASDGYAEHNCKTARKTVFFSVMLQYKFKRGGTTGEIIYNKWKK